MKPRRKSEAAGQRGNEEAVGYLYAEPCPEPNFSYLGHGGIGPLRPPAIYFFIAAWNCESSSCRLRLCIKNTKKSIMAQSKEMMRHNMIVELYELSDFVNCVQCHEMLDFMNCQTL